MTSYVVIEVTLQPGADAEDWVDRIEGLCACELGSVCDFDSITVTYRTGGVSDG